MSKLHVKKGDTVLVLSGKSRGKQGKVLEVSPKEGKVIVEKVNMVTKHVKPRREGEAGGRVEAEGALYACKVQFAPSAKCPQESAIRFSRTARRSESARTKTVAKRFKEGVK